MTDRPTGGQLTWRYVSGARLDGQPHTSSSAWARMPRWKRAAWRVGTPAALLAADLTHAAHPLAVDAALAGLAGLAVRAGRRRWRTRRFRKVYTRPTLGALRPALGDAPIHLFIDPSLGTLMTRLVKPMSPAEQRVRAWYGARIEPVLRWAPDRAQRAAWTVQGWARPLTAPIGAALRRPSTDKGPRIELRVQVPYLTAEQQQYVQAVIGAKLPAGELVGNFDQVGPNVTAVWTVRRRPPTTVGYADLAARLDGLKEWEFFLGLGVGGVPVKISLRDDSPHIACSAGSGAGKSVLAQLIGVQVLARGGRVVILDRKGSHRWAVGLPGVVYCTSAAQMHDTLISVAGLADDRNSRALSEPEDWDPGERWLVIAEELNASFSWLRDYWSDLRAPGEPLVSPAVKAFRNLLFMGRSAKVNVFAVAQMLTANTTGGPESRENFGVRCLARYTANNWKMLVDSVSMPRVSRTLGRWQIVTGGAAQETQVCYLTPAEARLIVHKHMGVPASLGSPLMAATSGLFPEHGFVGNTVADPLAELVTLRAAVERGIAPWSFDATKRRLQRAGRRESATVPQPAGKDGLAHLYRVGDLIIWIESELVP